MEKKLKCYIDKGRVAGGAEVRKEPLISVKPDASLIKPLKKITTYTGSFVAVDCSTRTLKRANNWGVYLMRASYATVRKRQVDWSYSERVCTVVGDSHVRRSFFQDFARARNTVKWIMGFLLLQSFQKWLRVSSS